MDLNSRSVGLRTLRYNCHDWQDGFPLPHSRKTRLCTIYGIDEYEGQPFFAMELPEGQTLRERLVGARGTT